MTTEHDARAIAQMEEDIENIRVEVIRRKLLQEHEHQNAPTPAISRASNEIADHIADQFFQVTSLFHADLRRQIMRAIDAERDVTRYYINQMGRWVSESNKHNPSFHSGALDKHSGSVVE